MHDIAQFARAALQGRRVLIVEDAFLLAMELQDLLERTGCIALGPVNTISRALAILESEQPDAALLDLNLDGIRSTSVASALAARHVPFVVVTAYGEISANETNMASGRRVDKPIDHGVLLQALSEVCTATNRG
jgi:CheY-like chemotaxis protein